MANIAPAVTRVHPSYVEPKLLLPYSQASGAFELLAGGDLMVRLSEGDLYVYINRIDVRTKVLGGQSAFNELPSCDIMLSQLQTPTYLMRCRAEYDHHDTAGMARYGVSIVDAQRLAMRQAHNQFARVALLSGINPSYGEGLLNTNGATLVSLPPDSNGNQTVETYDAGQMSFFLAGQIQQLKTRTNQLGLPQRIVMVGPQRVLGTFSYQDIVQLVQFQEPGAGTTSTLGVIKRILEMNEDAFVIGYDDTLIGAGSGGADAVIIAMPEVKKPAGSPINTNIFASLEPGLEGCIMQYSDMAAPREIPVPLPEGAIDVTSEWRITSGIGWRPESLTIVSMAYN
ncbi:MAG TPA: hypothetical protein VMV19_17530 [Xanthobacteraceae bacterium]|nr:hypothetical protein [Xanthobacteraceae bacterium]